MSGNPRVAASLEWSSLELVTGGCWPVPGACFRSGRVHVGGHAVPALMGRNTSAHVAVVGRMRQFCSQDSPRACMMSVACLEMDSADGNWSSPRAISAPALAARAARDAIGWTRTALNRRARKATSVCMMTIAASSGGKGFSRMLVEIEVTAERTRGSESCQSRCSGSKRVNATQRKSHTSALLRSSHQGARSLARTSCRAPHATCTTQLTLAPTHTAHLMLANPTTLLAPMQLMHTSRTQARTYPQ